MYVEQLYTKCLSEAAYYIESNNEVAIIDPLRDYEQYIEMASKRGAKIKYIFETHFHADFVSGHIDLAKKTGATIIYGPNVKVKYDIHSAKDGAIFELGNIHFKVIHTPGHTLESSCYLLHDENKKPYCIFTGDTLFVGDVGRPDLSSGNMTTEELAAIMYHTIQTKILPLDDDIIVYPAHGPGSSCGKSLGSETFTTIGVQKITNYALKPQTEAEFVAAVTDGLNAAPKYFAINATINQVGYNSLIDIKKTGLKKLSVEEFEKIDAHENIILDTRNETIFTEGFVPNSIFIGLGGRFAEWAATVLPFDKNIYLVTEIGKEEETLVRLTRVGLDNIKGYLKGGFEAWQASGKTIDMIIDIDADELAMDLPFDENAQIIDVRKTTEFEEGHVAKALNFPLSEINDTIQIAELTDNERANLYVHCAGGYRSVIASSILKKQGIHNLRNVLGGWNAIKEQSSKKGKGSKIKLDMPKKVKEKEFLNKY